MYSYGRRAWRDARRLATLALFFLSTIEFVLCCVSFGGVLGFATFGIGFGALVWTGEFGTGDLRTDVFQGGRGRDCRGKERCFVSIVVISVKSRDPSVLFSVLMLHVILCSFPSPRPVVGHSGFALIRALVKRRIRRTCTEQTGYTLLRGMCITRGTRLEERQGGGRGRQRRQGAREGDSSASFLLGAGSGGALAGGT